MQDLPTAAAGVETAPALRGRVFERDLGLLGSWLAVLTAPGAFFRRLGAGHEMYGREAMVRAGRGPDALLFYFVCTVVAMILRLIGGFSVAASLQVVFTALGAVIGMIVGFYIQAFVVHLISRLLRFPADFEAAKSVVGFLAAVAPAMALMLLLPAPGRVTGVMLVAGLGAALFWLALKNVYAVGAIRATMAWLLGGSLYVASMIVLVQIQGA